MKTITTLALTLLLTLWLAAGSQAQGRWGNTRGPAAGGKMYDTKTVETIRGEVVHIDEMQGGGRGRKKAGAGIHLTLKSDSGEIAVHLAPRWYLSQQEMKIAAGDQIEVRGSRILYGEKPAIIAAEVKKGGQSLMLRDDNGLPVWRGAGRR